jgi:hypothetical protein
MRFRFDQLAKRICRAALSWGGLVYTQHEVISDGQTVDIWFLPDPAGNAERERMGLLGRMTEGATMLEPFHNTPGIDELRDCVRKQLTMDHSRLAEARRERDPRPPFPRLWVLSTGRPESVIKGYDFKPIPGWPTGFLERQEADAVGLVVLRELPRERSTLILRLMSADTVLAEAIADLAALPEDAWERTVAMPVLIALRFEIPQNSADDEERTFLMSTMEQLYDEWEQKTKAEAREETLKESLLEVYQARFGTVPSEMVAVVEATHDEAVLSRWLNRTATGTPEEIAAALRL